MKKLLNQIKSLQNSDINKVVDSRLNEFNSFKNKSNEKWYEELCFCILAANSKQKTAENIQKKLGFEGLSTMPQDKLALFIRNNKHRFHNNKARYIVESRKYIKIKNILKDKDEFEARLWLVNNIKGIGYKEASHFLRNTGSKNLSILDRHIINAMSEHKIIDKPKSITPKLYQNIEIKFNNIAKQLNITPAKLDILIWYTKTGEVAK